MGDIVFLEAVDHSNQRVKNVASASAATDAVNKNDLDAAIRGLDWKQEVLAASTGNVSLASPGTTLDGVTLTNPSRVLLKDQTAQAENGIYVWTASGSALTRALDADSWAELTGSTVTVQQGTVNADRVYRVTADEGGTLGTTAVTFAQVGAGGTSYVGGNGLVLTGSTFDVGAGTGISVAADSVGIDTAVVTRKVNFNVGNGSLTSIALTHNLGTRDVQVQVYRNSTPWETVFCGVERTDTNTVTLTFATAPTSNQFRAIVQG